MTIKVWQAQFTDVPFNCALGTPADSKVFQEYRTLTSYNPAGVPYCHTPYAQDAQMWLDQNHSQSNLLYLLAITYPKGGSIPVNQNLALPAPNRVDSNGKTIAGLNLRGGRIDVSVLANGMALDKDVQLGMLVQMYDPEGADGRGTNVNYLVRPSDGVTLDEALGYTPASERTSVETVNNGWVDYSFEFPTDNLTTSRNETEYGLMPLSGRDDKVKAGIYGESFDIERAYECKLLNIMLVAFCGQKQPTIEPMNRTGGGYGEFYIRKFEVNVDPVLNPNAIAI